jgi:hypothetical protein
MSEVAMVWAARLPLVDRMFCHLYRYVPDRSDARDVARLNTIEAHLTAYRAVKREGED